MPSKKKKLTEKAGGKVKAWAITPLVWKPVVDFPDEFQAVPGNPFATPGDEGDYVGVSKHTCEACGTVDWSWGFGGDASNRGFASMEAAQSVAEAWWQQRVQNLLSPLPTISKTKPALKKTKGVKRGK